MATNGDIMDKLEQELSKYSTQPKGQACIPELADAIKNIDNLGDYVSKLTQDQLTGMKPVIQSYQRPKNPQDNGCHLALYWNSESQQLNLDWNDSGSW